MSRQDTTVELPEFDVRELLAAAEEMHDEAAHAPGLSPNDSTINVLDEQTERRFVLALDAIKARVSL